MSQSVSSPLVTIRLLKAISRFIEAHSWIAFSIVSLLCGRQRLYTLFTRPLDHDELYTYYIAQAPTLKQLLVLTRTVDLHPPLSYLLIRASFAVFGVSAWSCRLPSVLAFFGAAALLFWLVKRIFSPLYALVSLLFLWSVPLIYLADEARPYALVLCFTSVMLVSYYCAIDIHPEDVGRPQDPRFALFTLTVGGFALLLSHVLAVLPYAAFFAAELVRLSIRRKPDWKLWAALLAPAVCGLTYLPLLSIHSGIIFTEDYRPTPLRMMAFYLECVRFLTIPLVVVVLLAAIWPLVRRSMQKWNPLPDRRSAPLPIPSTTTLRPLYCLLSCFCLVPIAVGILFARTGTAFFDRYGIVILIPIALAPVLFLGFRTQRNEIAGAVMVFLLSVLLFLNTSGRIWLIEQLGNFASPRVTRYVLHATALPQILVDPITQRVPPHLRRAFEASRTVTNLDTVSPDLPLVANTGLTFLEIDQRGDAELTARLFLLNNQQAAVAIAHDTVFENYDRLKKFFPIRGRVEPYCDFVSAHPRFLVLGAYNHSQGWLLKKLDRDGADLKIIGTYQGTTEEAQLYEVTAPKAACSAQP